REIQVKVASDLPPVEADLDRAQDILVKLVDNANLYSSKEQPIIITAERAGDYVATSVADRGPGIDDLEQGMIFDKFYRGKDQRYLVRGTGMGLPIAKAIVTAHKGTIGVTSQLGHGSVFSFSLPVARRLDLNSGAKILTTSVLRLQELAINSLKDGLLFLTEGNDAGD